MKFFRDYYDPVAFTAAGFVYQEDREEAEHVLRTADAVKCHVFLFDMEWDMERTYEPVEFGDVVDWEYNPGDDPEFTWQFNRHRFLLCLGQAYRMTGDDSYAACMLDLMQQFIGSQADIAARRQTTWRILEIGIRAANWIKALYLIRDSRLLTDELLALFKESLQEHASILVREHYPYCYAGNWGILENHGLYLAGALLDCEEADAYCRQAAEVIDQALKMQVLPDGVQLEQSPMYHFEILQCVLEMAFFARLAGNVLPDSLHENIRKMAMAGLALRKPNGRQLSMGDSDDMNTRPIYALAAYVYEDAVFRWAGGASPGYDNIWLWGEKGTALYESLPAREPSFVSAQLYDSGHTVMRSSWNTDADLLHFDGGLLGTSHGHSDTLHIDLVLNGQDVLVDSGRYTYVTKPERFAFRGTAAHNTVQVDGMDIDEWSHSWFTRTVSAQSRQRFVERGGCRFVSAGHTGYMRLDNPVWVNRKVLQIGAEIYVVIDECYTSGEHTYAQYWHFDYRGRLGLEGHRAHFSNGAAKADLFLDERCDAEIFESKQSLHYNQMADNLGIQCICRKRGFHSMMTVCMKDAQQGDFVKKVPVKSFIDQKEYAEELAEGLKIAHGEKTYLVVAAHTEMTAPVTLYQVGDRMACGNVVVFDMDCCQYDGIVLNW